MEINRLPHAHLSLNDPVILEPCARKKHVVRFHGIKPSKVTHANLELVSSGYQSITPPKNLKCSGAVAAGRLQAETRSDTFFSSDDDQRQSMPFHFLSGRDEAQPSERLSESFSNEFTLTKIGTCHVIVRNDTKKLSFSFPRKSLPGAVFPVESSSATSLDERAADPKFRAANVRLEQSYLESVEQFAVLTQKVRKDKSQMQVFLSKLQSATRAEVEFLRSLSSSGNLAVNRRHSYVDPEAVNQHDRDECDSGTEDQKFLHPPKLGKVHVELQRHSKAWDEVLDSWREQREPTSYESNQLMMRWKVEVEELQWKILFSAQQLIEMRLKSLSNFVAQFYYNGGNERDWLDPRQSKTYKRICKIIEAYNKALRRMELSRENGAGARFTSGELSLSSPYNNAASSTVQALPESYKEDARSSEQVMLPQLFTSNRILTVLMGPSKQALAATLHEVLYLVKTCQSATDIDYDDSEEDDEANLLDLNWSEAHNIEVDEDDVITHVCDHELDNVLDQRSVIDSLSIVKHLLRINGKFVLTFLNCLAANTSLLRARVGGKTPRSISSSQVLGEGDISSNSDDDASSIASSLFGSTNMSSRTAVLRFGGSGGSSGGRPLTPLQSVKKTVLWRDSWDKDEVSDLVKSYMAGLVMQGAHTSLLPRLYFVQHPSYQPCYISDSEPFRTLAHVANMTTFDLLPKDILAHLRKAVQAIIAMKAISSWDRYTRILRQHAEEDSCKAFPPEGATNLCRTTLTSTSAVHALMHILDNFSSNDEVAKRSLSRLEATLDISHQWIRSKTEQFINEWDISRLMQVCLSDLSHVTNLALRCLPLVEHCHNHVERRRLESPGTLHQATIHLRNIDEVITDMQSLKGECMRMFKDKCETMSRKTVKSFFLSRRRWRQKKSNEYVCNEYMEKCCRRLLAPVCEAVSTMDTRCQLTAVPTILSALLDSIVRHINRRKICFSNGGATQLRCDVEYAIGFANQAEYSLRSEVARKLSSLPSVKRCIWMTEVLMRTDVVAPQPSSPPVRNLSRRQHHQHQQGNGGGNSFNRITTSRVAPLQPPESDSDDEEEEKWIPSESDLLALRILDKGGSKLKRFFSICTETRTVE